MISRLISVMPTAVHGVVLFGSQSRGDADMGSDTDIAIFADAASAEDLVRIKGNIGSNSGTAANLSVYSLTTAEDMAADGSLFLWHLKLEGKILFQRDHWFDMLLDHLSAYSYVKAERDLDTFAKVLDDVGSSLRRGTSTILFECATLFSVLRSLGMIASALSGDYCFGRLEPIYRIRERMGPRFRLTEEEINILLAAKLTYSRKKYGPVPQMTSAWCENIMRKVIEVMNYVRGGNCERVH
jgi:hypothetical protein